MSSEVSVFPRLRVCDPKLPASEAPWGVAHCPVLTPGPGWEVGEGREVHRPLEARRLVPPHSPPTPWFPEHSFPPLGRSWQGKKRGPPEPRWPAVSLPTAQGARSGHGRRDWGRLGRRYDVGQLPAVGQGGWNTVWEPAPHTTLSASSCLPRPGSEGQAGSTGPLLPLRPQPLLLAGPGGPQKALRPHRHCSMAQTQSSTGPSLPASASPPIVVPGPFISYSLMGHTGSLCAPARESRCPTPHPCWQRGIDHPRAHPGSLVWGHVRALSFLHHSVLLRPMGPAGPSQGGFWGAGGQPEPVHRHLLEGARGLDIGEHGGLRHACAI
ncbi:PREDICTED: translation initiation factor IF-2-like [Myotis davidii]|uniref:translation initiation factor IF-2-like n=1 Tax=Myotis davidii TaxID=225400 RepID=UPI0003EC518E|nr:PREDICTED: translation initiation factor IF-2-like [Myotis davidii]